MKTYTCCKAEGTPLGFNHSIAAVIVDTDGRMFGVDEGGRRGTQFHFCPFCGTPALVIAPHEQRDLSLEREVGEQSVDGRDGKNRFWTTFSNPELVDHCQFGEVHLLATDRCHARVRHVDGSILTVCFENITFRKLAPEPRVKKVKLKKSTESVVEKLKNKYLNLDEIV